MEKETDAQAGLLHVIKETHRRILQLQNAAQSMNQTIMVTEKVLDESRLLMQNALKQQEQLLFFGAKTPPTNFSQHEKLRVARQS